MSFKEDLVETGNGFAGTDADAKPRICRAQLTCLENIEISTLITRKDLTTR